MNFEDWYTKLVEEADIAISSPIKGCNVFLDYGFAIWERLKEIVDKRLKKLGYVNMYFPSYISPEDFKKEDDHHASFSREVVSCSAGEEKFIVRPTSEAVIYPSLGKVIQKKGLPLKINQWCSVTRWEILKPNFPLIRDNEFLWHECHSVFDNEEACDTEAKRLHELYKEILQDYAAIPAFEGRKPERRKFAGAEYTWALEALMQNGKSVQIATSHSLGQRFSKVFGLKTKDHVWQACAGLTTRVLGALIMVHGDDKGMILPPKLAPFQVGLIKNAQAIEGYSCMSASKEELIKKGIPIILGTTILRRDTLEEITITDLKKQIPELLEDIQNNLLSKAQGFKEQHTLKTDSYGSFKEHLSTMKGAAVADWCGDTECSRKIRKDTLGSLRVINPSQGKCIGCGSKAKYQAVFCQSY